MYLYIHRLEKETFVMNRCQKFVTSARSRAYAKGKVPSKTGMNDLEKRYADNLRTLQLAVGWLYRVSCSFRSMYFAWCSGIGKPDGRLNTIHPIINNDLCKSD